MTEQTSELKLDGNSTRIILFLKHVEPVGNALLLTSRKPLDTATSIAATTGSPDNLLDATILAHIDSLLPGSTLVPSALYLEDVAKDVMGKLGSGVRLNSVTAALNQRELSITVANGSSEDDSSASVKQATFELGIDHMELRDNESLSSQAASMLPDALDDTTAQACCTFPHVLEVGFHCKPFSVSQIYLQRSSSEVHHGTESLAISALRRQLSKTCICCLLIKHPSAELEANIKAMAKDFGKPTGHADASKSAVVCPTGDKKAISASVAVKAGAEASKAQVEEVSGRISEIESIYDEQDFSDEYDDSEDEDWVDIHGRRHLATQRRQCWE